MIHVAFSHLVLITTLEHPGVLTLISMQGSTPGMCLVETGLLYLTLRCCSFGSISMASALYLFAELNSWIVNITYVVQSWIVSDFALTQSRTFFSLSPVRKQHSVKPFLWGEGSQDTYLCHLQQHDFFNLFSIRDISGKKKICEGIDYLSPDGCLCNLPLVLKSCTPSLNCFPCPTFPHWFYFSEGT